MYAPENRIGSHFSLPMWCKQASRIAGVSAIIWETQVQASRVKTSLLPLTSCLEDAFGSKRDSQQIDLYEASSAASSGM